MNIKNQILISYLISIFLYDFIHCFNPNINNYDAYGLKIALNDLFFVQVHNANNPPTFFIQYAPYNNTLSSSQCSIFSSNTTEIFYLRKMFMYN